jgi:uncharacterized protein YggE
MRYSLVLMLALVWSLSALAQEPPAEKGTKRTVTVRGNGSASVQPDQVRMSIQVNVRGESASEAMKTASTRAQEVLTILRSVGVDTKDIQTTRVGVSPIYDYEKRTQPPPIIGYAATNDFNAVFRNAAMNRIGEFVDRAVTAGASTFGGLVYESSRERELERVALTGAAMDARARAEVLAAELGITLGEVISVTETGMHAPSPIVHDMRVEATMAAPVMTGEISVTANVEVVFAVQTR